MGLSRSAITPATPAAIPPTSSPLGSAIRGVVIDGKIIRPVPPIGGHRSPPEQR